MSIPLELTKQYTFTNHQEKEPIGALRLTTEETGYGANSVSFRWDTPKGKIRRQNHHLEHEHLLRLVANGALNNPKARPVDSTWET